MIIALTGGPCDLDPNSEMEMPGSSAISEQQLEEQEAPRNTRDDVALQSLISSKEWLRLHGLKSNKLTLKQILSQIGFPHCEGRVFTEQTQPACCPVASVEAVSILKVPQNPQVPEFILMSHP